MNKFICSLAVVMVLASCGSHVQPSSQGNESLRYVRSISDWSQNLDESGKRMGSMLGDLCDGHENRPDAIRKYAKRCHRMIDRKINEYSKLSPPTGCAEYRDVVIRYLNWQKLCIDRMVRELVPLALDRTVSREVRYDHVEKGLSSILATGVGLKRELRKLELDVLRNYTA